MKVQINAGALLAACDRYMLSEDSVYLQAKANMIRRLCQPVMHGWWLWKCTAARYSPEAASDAAQDWENRHRAANAPLNRAITFRDIAKHKNPNTLLELTDGELDGIAPYLAPFNDPNGRIE